MEYTTSKDECIDGNFLCVALVGSLWLIVAARVVFVAVLAWHL